jgi:hypothetical protein
MRFSRLILSVAVLAVTTITSADEPASGGPYKVIKTAKVGGAGGFDYVTADSDGRKLYVPRGNRVVVYDLDSLSQVGEIPETKSVHGVAIDPASGHGFVSSNPVVMFDTKELKTIKTIEVEGNPDGILFDRATDHVLVLSHRAPNVTVISSKDGSIVGTIDLGGAPEQGASDEQGKVYVNLEDKSKVAVVDSKANKLLTTYDLAGKGQGASGMGFDAKNHVIFSYCHNQKAIILNADDGKILATLPIGSGVDSGAFNPATGEAFSSQRDGTLTVIKETSPTTFEVEQTVHTKTGARTCALDTKTNQIYLITADFKPPPAGAQANSGRRRRGEMVPDSFTILVVGK